MNSKIRLILFAVVALAQLGFAASMLVNVQQLRKARLLSFPCRAYDPYDVLKGRYINISLLLTNTSVSAFDDLKGKTPAELAAMSSNSLYITFRRDSTGMAVPDKVMTSTVYNRFSIPASLVQTGGRYQVSYENQSYQFYMQEELAIEADRLLMEARRYPWETYRVTIHLKTGRKGSTMIDSVTVKDMPIEEYLKSAEWKARTNR